MAESNKKTLVYIIPGFQSTPRTMAQYVALVRNAYPEPDNDVILAEMPFRRLFRFTRAPKIVANQIDRITELCAKEDYDEIVLVGYSIGSAIAQRILVEAHGLQADWEGSQSGYPRNALATCVEPDLRCFDARPAPWATKVRRMVLLAGLGKGWTTDNTDSPGQRFLWSLGALACHMLPKISKPTIFDFRRGSPFIVQTRLRGLEFKPEDGRKLDIVQLVGSRDGLVAPEHSNDMMGDDVESNFVLAEVPFSDHYNIKNVDATEAGISEQEQEYRHERHKILTAALTGDREVLRDYQITAEHIMDELKQAHDENTKDIVFIIHGIRDRGYWTKKIAARIKKVAEAKSGAKFATRTPSYGYFPILPFLLPWYRLGKVEWMMDQYADVRAAYPDADLHYMGHSNGTYLCAKGLEVYPGVKFKRVMFAGSVVRPDFKWSELIEAGRVEKVFNAPATKDIVVALFPHGLRYFKWLFDLGGAGHVGFDNPDNNPNIYQLDRVGDKKTNMRYMIGNHKSARDESHWDEIAEFIVNGSEPDLENIDYEEKHALSASGIGIASTLIFPAFLIFAACLTLYLGFDAVASSFPTANSFTNALTWMMSGLAYPLSVLSFLNLADWWEGVGIGAKWLAFLGWFVALRTLTLRF